jgi:aminoglycoside 6'-N-acetyltransferase I
VAALQPQRACRRHDGRGRAAVALRNVAAHDDFGFAEASIRTDYVNGTDAAPVAFLECLYVAPEARRRGCARALVTAVHAWGRARGCREFASDASLANADCQAEHRALGFVETERSVYFRRSLR